MPIEDTERDWKAVGGLFLFSGESSEGLGYPTLWLLAIARGGGRGGPCKPSDPRFFLIEFFLTGGEGVVYNRVRVRAGEPWRRSECSRVRTKHLPDRRMEERWDGLYDG